jgi:hypothetical protein
MTNQLPGKSTAKDVFSYLLMITMLYVGVVSFITLLFQYVNASFPDVLEYYPMGQYEAMRMAISALLIVWPVYMLTSWFIGKDLRVDGAKRDIWVRKWLLYLTLFVASLTVIIDLITLVNYFLNGEVTTRFVLKVLVVLIVAVAVLAFYLWELRRDPSAKTRVTKISAIVSSTVILIAIIAGFFIIGTPKEQRAMRMDEQRVYDLQSIQNSTLDYWIRKDVLPETLATLQDPFSGYVAPVDPLTGESYEYTVKGDLEFEMCAVFQTDNPAGMNPNGGVYPRAVYNVYSDSSFDIWTHGVGRTCFTRVIDPDLYDEVKAGF